MANSGSKYGGGTSLFTLLTVLFIGLKLTGYIDWSWWWVLAPAWGPLVLALTIIGIALLLNG